MIMNQSTILFLVRKNYASVRSTLPAAHLLKVRCVNSPASSLSKPSETPNKENESVSSTALTHSSRDELLGSVSGDNKFRRRRKEILRLDPSEYENTYVGKQKIPLLDRRGEWQSVWKHLLPERKYNHIDVMALVQADIDLRPVAFKRLWRSIETEHELKQQAYNPERNRILGNELAAAHFIVFRKGRVKFLAQSDWITKYRDGANKDDDDDYNPFDFKSITLPTKYNPNYRLEAIDCEGVTIFYNGLANFEGLSHVNWLSFRNADKRFDDWCLDRIIRQFSHSLEYLDLSGCSGISARGLAAAWKLKHLKTLVLENLPQISDLAMVCTLLEEKLTGLTCVGVDFESGLQKLQAENAEFERKRKVQEEVIEGNTITVIPRIEAKQAESTTGNSEKPTS